MMREQAERLDLEPEQARELEREARRAAVRLYRWGRRLGLTREEVARDLGVRMGTLRVWDERWRRDRLLARPKGRPCRELSRDQRQTALWALHLTLGHIGVDRLMLLVQPPLSRAALVDLKARWRYAAHRRGGRLSARLAWTRPGAIWALDWTDAEATIDGLYPKILVVRDLASGMILLSLPCARESKNTVARELWRLVRKYGAPAVIKRDNGASLCCPAVALVLSYFGILALTSPPACPGYNGACEAGIGSLKVAAHHLASAAGREEAWSCDDVERARSSVNARLAASGLSAAETWRSRRPFGDRDREALWARYREHEALERSLRGVAPDAGLGRLEQASVDRRAITRALDEERLVYFRKRWIRPPIRGRKLLRKW